MFGLAADISPRFRWNAYDATVAQEMIRLEQTPEAVRRFAELCAGLSDYGYWFQLSTLWVSYTGWSDLALWRQLFGSERPGRRQCIMKPSELEALERLPNMLTVYRAHRPGETDWLSFTLSLDKAQMFAHKRGVKEVGRYRLYKKPKATTNWPSSACRSSSATRT